MKSQPFLLLALFLTSNWAIAQRGRNAAETNQNQQAMTANEAQLKRDLDELATFKTKLAQFEAAFADKNTEKVAAVKNELTFAMQREIQQSEHKIAQDKKEVAQSQSETAASKRETNRSRFDRATIDNDAKDAYDVRGDRRDRKDDQRDAMDDKNDLERQIARTSRQKQIYATLQDFTFSFEPSFQEKAAANLALLQEFASIMENDIAAIKAEMEEDKREAAEDRRERKEDRWERAEKRRKRGW